VEEEKIAFPKKKENAFVVRRFHFFLSFYPSNSNLVQTCVLTHTMQGIVSSICDFASSGDDTHHTALIQWNETLVADEKKFHSLPKRCWIQLVHAVLVT